MLITLLAFIIGCAVGGIFATQRAAKAAQKKQTAFDERVETLKAGATVEAAKLITFRDKFICAWHAGGKTNKLHLSRTCPHNAIELTKIFVDASMTSRGDAIDFEWCRTCSSKRKKN